MSHGGKRLGAGRKVSEERKATLRAGEEARVRALASLEGDETPLEYMLRIMRDRSADDKRRDSMATAAAQYLHPKLAAIEHSGDAENPIAVQNIDRPPRESREEWERRRARELLNGVGTPARAANGSH